MGGRARAHRALSSTFTCTQWPACERTQTGPTGNKTEHGKATILFVYVRNMYIHICIMIHISHHRRLPSARVCLVLLFNYCAVSIEPEKYLFSNGFLFCLPLPVCCLPPDNICPVCSAHPTHVRCVDTFCRRPVLCAVASVAAVC